MMLDLTGAIAAVALMMAAAAPALGALPEGWEAEGALAEAERWSVAQEPVAISAPLSAGTTTRLSLRLGALEQLAVCRVEGADGSALELRMQALDAEYAVNIVGPERIPLPDACVELRVPDPAGGWLFNDRYFVRPFPHWYEGDERQALLDRWSDLPGASEHPLALRVDLRDGHAGFWVDDRYVAGLPMAGDATLRLTLSAGNALAEAATAPAAHDRRWVPVGLHGYRRPGSWLAAEPSVGRGALRLGQVPFEVGAAGDEIDVALARWLREGVGPEGFTENYFTRNAFDSRPEDILLAIPTGDYSTAHLLCAVDDDPAETPIISLRLTRYLEDLYDSGGRGDGIADSAVRLERSRGRWPEGCRQVGTVAVTTDAGERELPLLQVAVPLRSGEIPDVIDEQGIFVRRSTQSLNLELTRALHEIKTSSSSHHSILPVGPPSGVHVLGLTLERAPVRVRLTSRQVGNVFYPDERPALRVEMTPQRDEPFEGELSWRLTDFYGRSTEGRRAVQVAADRASVAPVELPAEPFGWYEARLALHDSQGREVWAQTTSFAILPPDTREDEDSPYGVWWFRQSHIGTPEVADVAPLLQRMGVRKVNPGGRGPDGATLAAHGIEISMLTDFARRGEAGPAQLDELVAQHPDAEWAMVFHESGYGGSPVYPPEFIGKEPPELSPEQQAKLDDLQAKGLAYARYVREKYPHLKLIVGNGGLPFVVQLMREGWPKELVDAWGDENLGQAIPPEAPPPAHQSMFWQQQYSERFGYDVPMTTAYEWRGRNTQIGNVSELEQARLYSRDALQALAFEAPHINVGLLHDVGDSYYYSRWGAGGFCHRYPLMNPKPSYVAMATLTRELDSARFTRIVETPAPTLHIMEFERDGGYVYALWLPRGERPVELSFPGDAEMTLTDMNGNSRPVATRERQATLTVSASPVYLRTPVAIAAAAAAGPTQCEPPPAGLRVADRLNDPARWRAVQVADEKLDNGFFDIPRTLGDIDVAAVEDEQMGLSLELTLNPQPEVPWPVSRYVILQPAEPVVAPGEPTAMGLWLRGNSCWGRVFWEFEDARGERFFSVGASDGGWSVGDWEAHTQINFDGWNYLSVELPFRHASGFYGPPQRNWLPSGGDGVVDYPIRFTRLVVEMRDTVVRLTEPIAVPDRTVRLRDLSVSYGARVGEEPII